MLDSSDSVSIVNAVEVAKARICVVASYMRDVSVKVDRFPVPGETRIGSDGLETHGGKGSNQAVQAARCGAKVAIIAAVGADAAGRAAQQLWLSEGIDASSSVQREGHASGLAVIVVDGASENQIVIAAGANKTLSRSEIESARPLIEAANLVIAQLETPVACTVRAFELARSAGVQTLLNAAPAPESLPDQLWAVTDILVANEIESAMLAGMAAQTDPLLIGAALLKRVAVAVAITIGEQGAILFLKGQAPIRRAALPVAVLDSTGAGDAFVGAFSASWAAADSPARALALGVAAGSLACTGRGVVPSLADAATIERALAATSI